MQARLNGEVERGDTIAIVGAGPIGLAAIMTARLRSPAKIIAIDLADSRLARALNFGADVVINNGSEDTIARVIEITNGRGVKMAAARAWRSEREGPAATPPS